MRILQVPSLSHAIAEIAERNGHVRVIVRNLLPQREGFLFQGFGLLLLPIASCRPGKIVERARNRWMLGAEQFAAQRQNLTRCSFGFRPLAGIAQNNNKVPKGIYHILTFVSEHSLPCRQCLALQGFCLREFPISITGVSQVVFRSGDVRILIAKASPPDLKCFAVYLFSLPHFAVS